MAGRKACNARHLIGQIQNNFSADRHWLCHRDSIDPTMIGRLRTITIALIWIAALMTVWTGWDYLSKAMAYSKHDMDD